MRRGIEKRGLSPVVSSMFLILLIVFLAIFIFLWAQGFLGEKMEKFGEPIEGVCSRILFDVTQTSRTGDTYVLEVLNEGDVDIRYFDIKVSDGDGNSEITTFMFPADVGGDAVRESVGLAMNDGQDIEEVIVYPVLVGNKVGKGDNNVFTCVNSGAVI
ncbi:hypothetical protein HN903_00880 [archaeon]|jgi:hypothetical protein|nr:hypothetical protein [archaeon]MBT6955839.1 hypothetical protein [archaeon]MBT7128285.1 hypothetical protein [archaeon]